MATADNERYLRHVWLLGEGGLFVLRGIVTREATRCGQPLGHILSTNRTRFQNVLNEQKLKLFPSPSTANDNVETWDMSLLMLVVKRLFWASLSPAEQSYIQTLKAYRNNIQAHPATITMVATDYVTSRRLVEAALRQLASGISPDAAVKIDDIIKRTETGSLDIQLALQHIKDTHEFKISLLTALENKFDNVSLEMSNVSSKLSSVEVSIHNVEESNKTRHEAVATRLDGLHMAAKSSHQDISEVKANLKNMERTQDDKHDELKTQLQQVCKSTGTAQNGIAEVKELAARPKVLHDRDRDTIRNIEENVAEMKRSQTEIHKEVKAMQETVIDLAKRILSLEMSDFTRSTQKELQTIIQANCDSRKKKERALHLLFDFVKLIQNQDNFSEQEIKCMIEQRIQFYGNICLQLIDDLLNWFADISENRNAMLGIAQLGSIRIPIWCSSMEGVLKHMVYMDSEKCKERLSKISYSLSKLLGFPCSLSWTVVPDSLQNVMITLSERSKAANPTSKNMKIVLPFHIKSLEGLPIIWSMFEGDEANSHLTKVSETLSTIVGANISLTTSVVQDQLTKVVDEISKETASRSIETKERERNQLREDLATVAEEKRMLPTLPEPFASASSDTKPARTGMFATLKSALRSFFTFRSLPDESVTEEGQNSGSMPSYRGYQSKDPTQMAPVYNPSSRDRLQLDPKRDARERELEMRGQLTTENKQEPPDQNWSWGDDTLERELEMMKKLIAENELKPPGLDLLLPPGASHLDPHWLKTQRTASDLMACESEGFERLDDHLFEGSLNLTKIRLDDDETQKRQKDSEFDKTCRYSRDVLAGVDQTKGSTVLGIDSAHSELKERHGIVEGAHKQVHEHQLGSKPVQQYSVTDNLDSHTPYITGIELLPNGGILLTDWSNKRLKMLNNTFQSVSDCDLPDHPLDVCYIGNGRAAVILGHTGIQFANVSGYIERENVVQLDHDCSSIARFGDTMYITDKRGTVYTYTTDATQKRVLYKRQDENVLSFHSHIAISDDGHMIYIAFGHNGLITIDSRGHHLTTFKTATFNYALNVCVVGDGTILVCDCSSPDMLQLDYGGRRILRKALTLSQGFQPQGMCYDRQHSRLIVGSYNTDVYVFEL